MANFASTCTDLDGLAVIAVSGEVDLAAFDELWDRISTRLEPRAFVVLDCAAVTFFDSMGVKALVRARNQAVRVGARLVLVGAPEPVSRVLRLTGLAHLFPAFRDLPAARAARDGDGDGTGVGIASGGNDGSA